MNNLFLTLKEACFELNKRGFICDGEFAVKPKNKKFMVGIEWCEYQQAYVPIVRDVDFDFPKVITRLNTEYYGHGELN